MREFSSFNTVLLFWGPYYMHAYDKLHIYTFWWLHHKELLPKMNPWYSAFLFAVSVCSQINWTYIYLKALKEEILAHKSLIQWYKLENAPETSGTSWGCVCHKQELRLSTRFQDSITTSPPYPPWAYTAHFASWVIRLHSSVSEWGAL